MEKLLTVDDLSEALSVTSVCVYKWVREKKIPFIHVERCVRFKPSDIDEWLEERKNKTCPLGARKRVQE